eukprot:5491952-Alexandrium_andersonii.AAC.1
MAEVLQLLGDGGVEVQQLLVERVDLGPEAFGNGGLLRLGIPDALELARTASEEGLHSRPSFTDRAALGLKLCPSLINQARDH